MSANFAKIEITQSSLEHWLEALGTDIAFFNKFAQNDAIKAIEYYWEASAIADKITDYLAQGGQGNENTTRALQDLKSEKILTTLTSAYQSAAGKFFKEEKWEDCINYYKTGLLIKDNNHWVHNMMGRAFQNLEMQKESIGAHEKAVKMKPDFADGHLGLANAYTVKGEACDYGKALPHYEKYLELANDKHLAYWNLGRTVSNLGYTDRTMEYFDAAIEIKNDNVGFLSSYMLNFLRSNGFDQEKIKAVTVRVVEDFLKNVGVVKNKYVHGRNRKKLNKRIHLAYMTEDFRNSTVMNFFFPVYENHNREDFEITLVSKSKKSDTKTEKLQNMAKELGDSFLDLSGLTLEQTADEIYKHNIDILVDLDVLTNYSTYLSLAYKPAPIQAVWLGYPNTSGLDTIDYILTDTDTIKPNEAGGYVEKLAYIKAGYEVFAPDYNRLPAEINEAPCLKNGYVTFGSFNNPNKFSQEVLDAWGEILSRVENSRMHFHYLNNFCDENIKYLQEKFAKWGVAPERLTFARNAGGSYYNQMQNADIALDPTPYSGTSTTIDSLLCSLPVIAFEGNNSNSRPSSRILKQAGLSELIGADRAQYVEIAVNLAHDRERITNYRANIKSMFEKSPICDYKAFVASLEQTYKEIWKGYCAS